MLLDFSFSDFHTAQLKQSSKTTIDIGNQIERTTPSEELQVNAIMKHSVSIMNMPAETHECADWLKRQLHRSFSKS